MAWIVQNLWLVPFFPLLAGGVIALTPQRQKLLSISCALGAIVVSLVLSMLAFVATLHRGSGELARVVSNHDWFQMGHEWFRIGWMLDPLNAVMLVMVTFVGLLIFIFSTGYMTDDENVTRFFGFLSVFAGAMLGVLISNSLLTLFMCWEVVGLTSYLLIGFWYQKPSAAAAAKKAFVVTRVGDLGLFLGMVWLYAHTGTLLFYDAGKGCLETGALSSLAGHVTACGMLTSTAIAVLIFCGAAGKSGQFPLHVWLPDAMEGPTPVSALIHAATMVAAGVFLVARVYPLMSLSTNGLAGLSGSTALDVVTWTGAITALFGAMVAVAQWDIKRILAYSTVSQLGYMMIGIGTGGVAVGMFHLITHAFFKALLFLGAGSVIHGCGGEQDIRKMGGLRKAMPSTFVAYTAGMLALSGFPLFSGFWSKDAILHAASVWSPSHLPFYMGATGALLTAFYMTRQMVYVFAGTNRADNHDATEVGDHGGHGHGAPHESPMIMVGPLLVLGVFAVALGFVGTEAWPWFQTFLEGESLRFDVHALGESAGLMAASVALVLVGIGVGWALYGRQRSDGLVDPIQVKAAPVFGVLHSAFYMNELYAMTVVKLVGVAAQLSLWMDVHLWGGVVRSVVQATVAVAKADEAVDARVVNGGFDATCVGVSSGARGVSSIESGRIQSYLRSLGLALIAIALLLLWGGRA